MHVTVNCYTNKNREKWGLQGTNRSFSNKSFCKEINTLAKNSLKKGLRLVRNHRKMQASQAK